jgi:uncharacterized protein
VTRQGPREPSFEVTHEAIPPDSFVVGFSEFGPAGLTAVEYLTHRLELDESGHVTAGGVPASLSSRTGWMRGSGPQVSIINWDRY